MQFRTPSSFWRDIAFYVLRRIILCPLIIVKRRVNRVVPTRARIFLESLVRGFTSRMHSACRQRAAPVVSNFVENRVPCARSFHYSWGAISVLVWSKLKLKWCICMTISYIISVILTIQWIIIIAGLWRCRLRLDGVEVLSCARTAVYCCSLSDCCCSASSELVMIQCFTVVRTEQQSLHRTAVFPRGCSEQSQNQHRVSALQQRREEVKEAFKRGQ